MGKTDRDWEYWGKHDPYFGVLRDDRFRKDNQEENRETFFTSGRNHMAYRLQHLETHLGAIPRGRAVDFGCGVGRMSQAMAEHFGEVVGVDISPSMLDEARENAATAGLANIDYVLSDDALSNAPGQYDFVHTAIVLQHIPVDRGMVIIDSLLSKTAPGGVASLHLCVSADIGKLKSASYGLRQRSQLFQSVTNLLNGRSWGEPPMQMNAYPLPEVLAAFTREGLGTTLVDTEQHGEYMTVHVAGRKR